MKKRPSILSVFIIPIVLVVAALLLGKMAFSGFLSQWGSDSEPIEIKAPGVTYFTIEEAGNYTLWLHTQTQVGEERLAFSSELPPGFQLLCQRLSEENQELGDSPVEEVAAQDAMQAMVNINGEERCSVKKFFFANPGKYSLQVQGFAAPVPMSLKRATMQKFSSTNWTMAIVAVLLLLAAPIVFMIRLILHGSKVRRWLDGRTA